MSTGRVRLGIDAFLDDPRRYVPGRHVGLLTNQAALTGDGVPSVEALRTHPDLHLRTLFTFEHGLSGFMEDARPVADGLDPRTGLHLHSLYGPRRRADPAVVAELDAVIVDVQEVGVRAYTYATTVALLLEAAAEAGVRVVVCDRPNLLGPNIAGPPLDPTHRSFLGYLNVPFQHGLTLGELARLHAATALAGGAEPTVAPLSGWRRDAPSDEGLFVPPSPGLPTRDAVLLYPGLVLLEGVNLSEGRGTPLPFALVGAPWLESYALAHELNEAGFAGLWARPLDFAPEAGPFRGRICHGVQVHVTDRSAVRAFEAGVRILAHLRANHDALAFTDAADMPWSADPDAGRPWHEPCRGPLMDGLTGGEEVRAVIEGRADLADVLPAWREAGDRFLGTVAPHLLYDPAPVVTAPAEVVPVRTAS